MIDLQQDGRVTRLVLNRPQVRNALAMDNWEELADRLGSLADTGIQLLVVRGADGVFCAGADLSEFDRLRTDEVARRRFRLVMRRAIDALRSLPMATVAQVEGPCFGAGVALAMACDIRVAAPGARFAITPAKIGIGYPQEDVERLVSLVGSGWAARLLFTGEAVSAEQAERIGLVQEVADAAGADRLIAAILACDPQSIFMLKRGLALGARGIAHDPGQDQRFDALFGSDALAERLSRRRGPASLPAEKP